MSVLNDIRLGDIRSALSQILLGAAERERQKAAQRHLSQEEIAQIKITEAKNYFAEMLACDSDRATECWSQITDCLDAAKVGYEALYEGPGTIPVAERIPLIEAELVKRQKAAQIRDARIECEVLLNVNTEFALDFLRDPTQGTYKNLFSESLAEIKADMEKHLLQAGVGYEAFLGRVDTYAKEVAEKRLADVGIAYEALIRPEESAEGLKSKISAACSAIVKTQAVRRAKAYWKKGETLKTLREALHVRREIVDILKDYPEGWAYLVQDSEGMEAETTARASVDNLCHALAERDFKEQILAEEVVNVDFVFNHHKRVFADFGFLVDNPIDPTKTVNETIADAHELIKREGPQRALMRRRPYGSPRQSRAI